MLCDLTLLDRGRMGPRISLISWSPAWVRTLTKKFRVPYWLGYLERSASISLHELWAFQMLMSSVFQVVSELCECFSCKLHNLFTAVQSTFLFSRCFCYVCLKKYL